ncbi:MAG: site-2 protease family protein [Chloroflexi bacterium]|nr:site-2 protease family protein [Chloroflexota bacterium]
MLGFELSTLLARAITLLAGFTVHEFAHAWVAYQLGDTSQASQGRLTLDPRAHIIPWMYLFAVITGFGMAKPVTWYPGLLRMDVRKAGMLIAVAGPISNVLMALLAGIPVRLGLLGLSSVSSNQFFPSPSYLLYIFILINLVMAVFNMIPVPPLDGYRVLLGLLPDSLALEYQRLEQWGMFILMGLILLGSFGPFDVLGLMIGPPIRLLFHLAAG